MKQIQVGEIFTNVKPLSCSWLQLAATCSPPTPARTSLIAPSSAGVYETFSASWSIMKCAMIWSTIEKTYLKRSHQEKNYAICIVVFCVMTPHTAIRGTNISEERTTPIYRVASRWKQFCSKMLVCTCWTACCHNIEDHNINLCYHENLKLKTIYVIIS